jgi:hypothetical protein
MEDAPHPDALASSDGAANLEPGLDLLGALIRARLTGDDVAPEGHVAIRYFDDGSPLGNVIRDRQPPFEEYVVLMLALAPHVRPGFLDAAIRAALPQGGDFPEIGGVRDEALRALVPTGETAAYLLAGDDLAARFAVQRLFSPDHWLAREGLLRLDPVREGMPVLSGRIIMARDWVERFTIGHPEAPAFGPDFPARRIETALAWEDLVLAGPVRAQIGEIEDWLAHAPTLMRDWGMAGRLRPGYRALFHGPPGTGKTLTATLIGRATGREVYRVDLSTVVSKWIGETEKNLAALFDRARARDWILFFDEADALFGKRSAVKEANDRYANQEVSYLLQRVEEVDGLVILATNARANMDEAFLRRFNAIVRFPMPTEIERRAIWLRMLPAHGPRERLAVRLACFELSGGNIVNAVQFAAIAAIAAGRGAISLADAVRSVEREMEKEGRIFRNLIDEQDC